MEDVLIVKHKCSLKYHKVIVQKGKLMLNWRVEDYGEVENRSYVKPIDITSR